MAQTKDYLLCGTKVELYYQHFQIPIFIGTIEYSAYTNDNCYYNCEATSYGNIVVDNTNEYKSYLLFEDKTKIDCEVNIISSTLNQIPMTTTTTSSSYYTNQIPGAQEYIISFTVFSDSEIIKKEPEKWTKYNRFEIMDI